MSDTTLEPTQPRRRGVNGMLIAVIVLVLVAIVGYVWLRSQGLLGADASASPSPDPSASLGSPSASPPPLGAQQRDWLKGEVRELPPLVVGQDIREPEAREMADWVWNYVDDTWNLYVVRGDALDGNPYLTDLQVLFLESPEADVFRVFELRQDVLVDVVHWSPEEAVVWLARSGRTEQSTVIQYGLRDDTVPENWDNGAAPLVNHLDGEVADVTYVGDLPDGRELWSGYGPEGDVTGVFWRNIDGTFDSSTIQQELRRLSRLGYDVADTWMDLAGSRVIYRAELRDVDTGQLTNERWLLHDLVSEDWGDVSPQRPEGTICSAGDWRMPAAQIDGDRILATCLPEDGTGGSVLRIDPTGAQPPL